MYYLYTANCSKSICWIFVIYKQNLITPHNNVFVDYFNGNRDHICIPSILSLLSMLEKVLNRPCLYFSAVSHLSGLNVQMVKIVKLNKVQSSMSPS